MIRQNVDAARSVWQNFEDVALPEAIEAYFVLYRSIKGDDALDQKKILSGLNGTMEGRIFPFATAAQRFRLIESSAVTVYVPLPENAALLDALRNGQCSREIYRRLGQYGVSVYPDHLAKLLAAGAVEQVDGEAWLLTDAALYNRDMGLALDVETGKKIFV